MKTTVMKKDGAYFPIMESDVDKLNKFADGEVLEIQIKKDRFYPHHQKYWALCNMVAQNHKELEELRGLDNKDKVDEYIKLKIGHIDCRLIIEGKVHIKTKSIGYPGMDQAAFQEFFDQAVEVMSRISGISVYNLLVNWMDYECGVK